MLNFLKYWGTVLRYIPLAELHPSEFDTWEIACIELEINPGHRRNYLPVGVEIHLGLLEVQDGHHRCCTAFLNGECDVFAFVVPPEWSKEKRHSFWKAYNEGDYQC